MRKTSDPSTVDYVISGTGGKGLDEYTSENEEEMTNLGYKSLFFRAEYGFVTMLIQNQVMRATYFKYDTQSAEDTEDTEDVAVAMYSFTKHHAH